MIAVKVNIRRAELERFNGRLGHRSDRATVNTALATRKIGFEVMRDIMRLTPVDTGRHRAGWSAVFPELGKTAPPTGGSQGRDSKGRFTASGESEASSYLPRTSAELKNRSRGARSITSAAGREVHFEVRNNVRAIVPLEFGWSKEQAPNGMVRVTLRRYAPQFRAVIRLAMLKP